MAKGVADDFDNANEVFVEFGKNFMKTIGVSPDAFMQMALQMAYYLVRWDKRMILITTYQLNTGSRQIWVDLRADNDTNV